MLPSNSIPLIIQPLILLNLFLHLDAIDTRKGKGTA